MNIKTNIRKAFLNLLHKPPPLHTHSTKCLIETKVIVASDTNSSSILNLPKKQLLLH